MIPSQGQGSEGDEKLSLDDIPAEIIKEEEMKMLPGREEAFLSEIDGMDVESDLKDELKAFVRGDYGRLAYHLYPNLKGKVDDPKLRAMIVGELTLKDKHKINVKMLEMLSELKDPVLVERIKTYVTVEKVHKAALSDADDDLVRTDDDLRDANVRIKRLQESASKDGLTGLWNRRVFDESIVSVVDRVTRKKEAIEKAIEAAKEAEVSVDAVLEIEKSRSAFLVMIDIDHFKQVNDTYGHQAGDFVLMELAKLLQQGNRKSEKPFRYGGEEFAIIADGIDYNGMEIMANRIREKVAEHDFIYDGKKIDITISLGVAGLADLGDGADAALYHAKESGRNVVTRADDSAFLDHLKRKVSEVELEQTQE
jgi:diguanylate cyclase (GGDEF)-like protein